MSNQQTQSQHARARVCAVTVQKVELGLARTRELVRRPQEGAPLGWRDKALGSTPPHTAGKIHREVGVAQRGLLMTS